MLKNLFAFSTEKISKKIRRLVFGKFVKTCHELDISKISTLSLLTKAFGSHPCPNCPHDQFNPYPLHFLYILNIWYIH